MDNRNALARAYKVEVFDASDKDHPAFVEATWEGDSFEKAEYEYEYAYNRLAGLVRIGEISPGETRIVLAQYDGTVEKEVTV